MHKVIEPEEVVDKTKLTAPHTVHCLADGRIMISMLGDEKGDGPGGFLLLDDKFEVAGRWEASTRRDELQLRLLVSAAAQRDGQQRVGAPRTRSRPGFKLDDVKAGKYGQHLHFWDWKERKIAKSVDLGEKGMIPLEVRFHHNPDSTHGFVGAALSSVDVALAQGRRRVEGREGHRSASRQGRQGLGLPGAGPDHRSGAVAGRPLALLLQLAARRHPPVRRQRPGQAEARPAKSGSAACSARRRRSAARSSTGGPQMLQLSLDGKRLYVTNSLFSSWDNQFYPNIGKQGSYMLQIDCDTEKGGLKLNDRFLVDFGKEPDGPARPRDALPERGFDVGHLALMCAVSPRIGHSLIWNRLGGNLYAKSPRSRVVHCRVLVHLPAWACTNPSGGQAVRVDEQGLHFIAKKSPATAAMSTYYSLDLKRRWGEGKATPDTLFVQPPGTPTVGMAYLKAFKPRPATSSISTPPAKPPRHWLWPTPDPAAGRRPFTSGRPSVSANTATAKAGTGTSPRSTTARPRRPCTCSCTLDAALDFKHAAIHEAATYGLDALLKAQFANGAFPQVWTGPVGSKPVAKAKFPDYDWKTEGRVKNYWDYYTLNDNLAGTVADALIEAHQVTRTTKYKAALAKLGDFLILAQMPDPQPGWCQQYNDEMVPIWARKFEPPAITGWESQDVMETLIQIARLHGREEVPGADPARARVLQEVAVARRAASRATTNSRRTSRSTWTRSTSSPTTTPPPQALRLEAAGPLPGDREGVSRRKGRRRRETNRRGRERGRPDHPRIG